MKDFYRLLDSHGQPGGVATSYHAYENRLNVLADQARRHGADRVYFLTIDLDWWRKELRHRNLPDTPQGWGRCAVQLFTPQDRLALKIGENYIGWARLIAPGLPEDGVTVERVV